MMSFTEAVNEAVEQKVKERVELEVKNAVEKLDEDHTVKVQKLIESIDGSHTKMFQDVVAKIDESHTKKLQVVVEKFQKELKENADEFKAGLVKKVSKFMDAKIDQMIPRDHLKEAVENIQARKLVQEMKKLLSYDPEGINDDVKTALKEGYDAIEGLKAQLNEKAKENLLIKENMNKFRAEVLLEKKTQDLPKAKKNFVYKFMGDKNPEYIESNFNYVLEMFEENEKENTEVLKESATAKSVSKTVKVPPSQIKDNETLNESSSGDEVSEYLTMMSEQDTFYK
jgi:putative lipoic acid-binding regulatory protein